MVGLKEVGSELGRASALQQSPWYCIFNGISVYIKCFGLFPQGVSCLSEW